ncbi:P-loop containing nucleoside triphosphate hydrolase protein [Athelia psychrophila]|uniref:P-loop containing nucleoside triphosphate hydrolase protein n=1 Tax=Athelia psychrophila TaxID=1759441 RepID=A0A166CR70_9AGAM|nr:P-loop containing nucleoside triphosphate hydrolase protein [Fibularhizoctonia sp. CBS 109695]
MPVRIFWRLYGAQHGAGGRGPLSHQSISSPILQSNPAYSERIMDTQRASKLNKLLENVLSGRQAITGPNGALFLEAVCAQTDAATCLGKLMSSNAGFAAVQAAMRTNVSPAFLNGSATPLLIYLQAPELTAISGGDVLNQLLVQIVDPPFFWTPFIRAFTEKMLQDAGQLSFAWLLFRLISLPGEAAGPYRDIANQDNILDLILNSPKTETRVIGSAIKHILDTHGTGLAVDADFGPGGRHDNDAVDVRDITILPTADEIVSQQPPFLRPSAMLEDPNTEDTRLASYFDNHFRLLREDMLYEMREELQIALGKKKGHHRGLVIEGFRVLDLHCGTEDRRTKWGITIECNHDLWAFKKVKVKDRRSHLADNRKILKHQSLTCLIVDGEVVAFATINRDEDLLATHPRPIIILQFEGEASTINALIALKAGKHFKLVQIDTAVFSFEPVLKRLQAAKTVPLSTELVFWKADSTLERPSFCPSRVLEAIQADPHQDLQGLLNTSKSIKLDNSQAASLIAGLSQNVALIQGPPGTGKSFIGALLAKAINDFTSQSILVVCYTNHALDQFLEDLMDIGIPQAQMVRLGGKSTTRTTPLTLQNQNATGYRMGKTDWTIINELKSESKTLYNRLSTSFNAYHGTNIHDGVLMDHLEFADPDYFFALSLPQTSDGMTRVGKKGNKLHPLYLLNQWKMGWDAGTFKYHAQVQGAPDIWGMPPNLRQQRISGWKAEILKEQAETIHVVAKLFNECQDRLDRKFNERVGAVLASKRIIGCTTTAAAKYSIDIQAASPGVLLVEEAGEILESHVLTAMGEKTAQLILIGDHKQLRPKVNNYQLTVEKGEGYDLNRSLFERLVLKGYPHETLNQQHRMRPEISQLIRSLTYPDLVDAPSTKSRGNIRGVRDVIVFIDHSHPEDEAPQLADMRDMSSKSSKQNTYEVEMVLKMVRYLGQQGYGTDKLVILTPYLGQLQKLQEALRIDNDPVLNDLDSFDLVRAGLLPSASGRVKKNPIRLATIDNYQGEESEIVIATLTRSNAAHDIGFMSSPERLNVLLSRARDSLIIIGNSNTFLNARKGSELWNNFFNLIKRGGHIYDGFPVRCERHMDRTALLSKPTDFDAECPDGGCKEACGTMLNCGVHLCPSKCHQLYDHSKMACEHIMPSKCPNGHDTSWKCHKPPPATCAKCEKKAKDDAVKQQKAFERQQQMDAEQAEHVRLMAELQEQVAAERAKIRDAQLAQERERAIQEKKKELRESASLAARKSRSTAVPSPTATTASSREGSAAPPESAPGSPTAHTGSTIPPEVTTEELTEEAVQAPNQPLPESKAQVEWEYLKNIQGVSNDAIDGIMKLIGLEAVKSQVLGIHAKIETTKRQNTSMKDERFNIALLGNPGTGKTTVARLYAKFLTSVDVLPGNAFVETTGSRLANDGVAGVKKHIEDVVSQGGGTVFCDEAYQLTSEHNFQGRQVLDFLLAEMENQVGTIVFIFAGYNKEMEKFFEHNPGLASRVPHRLQFDDYTNAELLTMLEKKIDKKYGGRMNVERGIHGLYGRIAIQRLAKSRGTQGFGNARALEILLARITDRQAKRLHNEVRQGGSPDHFLLRKEDIIGPDPSAALLNNPAWEKLQSLIGLESVKESIRIQLDRISTNYLRELQDKKPVETSLNRVFFGGPGTGKTSVAKLYGQILADLGLLSNGEVVVKNPADFIGAALGQSEANTKAILASSIGKVLVIDEAYMLYGGSGNAGNQGDPYKTAVIDTMVAEIQSVPGEDRCVLLLGYKDQMEDMFQNVNPGLSRRFAIDDAFHFTDFDDNELLQILQLKMKDQDLAATDPAKVVAIEVLARSRNRPNFGNGGEVENLLGRAKANYQTRNARLPLSQRPLDIVFEPQDFDVDFNRNANASDNLQKLFEDVVDCEEIVAKLAGYQKISRTMKARGMDMRKNIPTNFIFKGPPGTGKTTTARKMGQVYFDMGFLSSTEVVECSASDLVGQYVGQTGPKTKRQLETSLGKVLFVDEAYRLSEGHFAQEAIDELVGLLTQEPFFGKLVVILAGYDQDMNRLMAVNSGLSSRFPDVVIFRNMSPTSCLKLLDKDLKKKDVSLAELADNTSEVYRKLEYLVQELSRLPSWGNARDMITVSKAMVNLVLQGAAEESSDKLVLSGSEAISCMTSMLAERLERTTNVPTGPTGPTHNLQLPPNQPLLPPPSHNVQTTQVIESIESPKLKAEPSPVAELDSRDAGVADHVWKQLQKDVQDQAIASKAAEDAMRAVQESLRQAAEKELAQQQLIQQKLQEQARAKDAAEKEELRRQLEEARIRESLAKAERERIAAALEAKRQEEARRRKQEAQAQAKLRQMGVCVAGYQWIKQSSGYRCAGGSHFVSNSQLEM